MSTNKSSRRRARLNANPTPTPAPVAQTAAPQPAPASASKDDWRHDYDYVSKDLRKLFIVSGSLFAIIILLGFFI
jgi:hypothetical protein